MDEFQLINRYFSRPVNDASVIIGSGDDCALLSVPNDQQLVVSIDTLIEGTHFPTDTSADDIGYKAMAVSISDLAACGAEPKWMTGALTMPALNEDWVAGFTKGMFEILDAHHVTLIGGDMTRGKLSITTQAHGFVPQGKVLTRSGAQVGDLIYVTGYLGDAGYALQNPEHLSESEQAYIQQRLNRPTPRVDVGLALRDIATSCIDISDGFAQDLQHILTRSQVGAEIDVTQLPLSTVLQTLPKEQAYQLALTSGDDYELCFTLPQQHAAKLEKLSTPCTRVGAITEMMGLRLMPDSIKLPEIIGYKHFS